MKHLIRWVPSERNRRLFPALLAVQLFACEGAGGTSKPDGHEPVAKLRGNQSVDTGARVTLDASASSDPDGDELSYVWRKLGGPAVSLSSTSKPIVTFTAPDHGAALTFEVTVSDATHEVSAQAVVTVLPAESLAHVDEMRERSVTEDSAAMGDLGDDWLVDVGNDLPQAGAGGDAGQASDEADKAGDELELPEFVEMFKATQVPEIVEGPLGMGQTRRVALDIAGASGLAGLVQWIGTTEALKVRMVLGGHELVSGTPYAIGRDRGGSYAQARTKAGGQAVLEVTNTSGQNVKVRLLLAGTRIEAE